MSDLRARRRSSSRRSSKRRRRRKSSVSVTSWNSGRSDGFGDEDDEEMIRRFADDDDDEEDDGEEDRGRRSNKTRKNRNRRKSEQSYGRRRSGREEDEEKEEEETMTEEMIVEKINRCKELIESVKLQTWKMSKKMKVLRKARAYVETFEGKLSRSRNYQQRWKQFYKQVERLWANLMAALLPWEMRIKRIESHFGSVVASYFIFLRWLIWISVWLAVLPLCFIILPELISGKDADSSVRKQIPETEKTISHDLETIWDAEGAIKYSLMFYGYYGNDEEIGQGYRLPLAYLLTSLAAFAYSFVVVLKTMANNSRQSRLSGAEDEFIFSWKLFTEWDFMIESHETATTKRASIITTFKETILEEQEKEREGNKYLLVSLRVLANFIILLLLALSTYVIQLFVERSREMELKKRNDPNYEAGFWAENELTVIMTLIATLFPNVLDLVSLMEQYHPRTSLRLMLARIFVLNLLNLYTLFIALYNKQNDLLDAIEDARQNGTYITQTTCIPSILSASLDSSIMTQTIVPSSVAALADVTPSFNDASSVPNATSVPYTAETVTVCSNYTANAAAQTLENDLCWETMIGQETFKLTVMDTVFVLGQILIIDVIRTYFIKHCNSLCCWDMEKTFPEYPDFKTAENLLHLISNQGTIWLGAFFSPGLPLLNLLKLVMMLYVRCWTVMTYNAPQQRIFRASRSNNFYFALLLVMLFLCMLPPLFAIVAIEPSPNCGPFSGQSRIYHMLTSTMKSELPETVNVVIEYAASPGVILPVFMLLGMTIYYLLAVGRSMKEANRQLTMQLEYERTEGRRKVYAMADAKHEGHQKAGAKGWQKAKVKVLGNQGMADAAASIISEMKAKKSGNQEAGGGASKRAQSRNAIAQRMQAVARKQMASAMLQRGSTKPAREPDKSVGTNKTSRAPQIPIAIVKGKQSVKINPAGSRDRARHHLRSAFKATKKHQDHNDDDGHEIIGTRNRRNQRMSRKSKAKNRQSSTDEENGEDKIEEEQEEEEEEEEGEEDEEQRNEYNNNNNNDEDDSNENISANDDNEDDENPARERGKQKNTNNSKNRRDLKTRPQNSEKKTPPPPPPPPPPPTMPSGQKSKARSADATTSEGAKVDVSGGGSVMDRIKMFQKNTGASHDERGPTSNRKTTTINDQSSDKKSDAPVKGNRRSENSGTNQVASTSVKADKLDQKGSRNRRDHEDRLSNQRSAELGGRQNKSGRKFSDSKGHLIPYNNANSDDNDDGSESDDETNSSDESLHEDTGNDSNIINDKSKSTPGDASDLQNKKTPGVLKKASKFGGVVLDHAKETPSTSGSSPSKIKNNPKSSKASKAKHPHKRVVEAQIEIVNETKTSGSKKRGSIIGRKEKLKVSRESVAVPSIKIEDFSDNGAGIAERVKESDITENTDTISESPNGKPVAGPSQNHDRNHNGNEILINEAQNRTATWEQGVDTDEKTNTEISKGNDHLTSIMKSKGKLAKWRRIASGLKKRDKRKGDLKTVEIKAGGSNQKKNRITKFAGIIDSGTIDKPRKQFGKGGEVPMGNENNRKMSIISRGEPNESQQSMTTSTINDKDQRSGIPILERAIPIVDNADTLAGENRSSGQPSMPSPLIDYYSDDDCFGASDTDQQELTRRRRRKSFLYKRPSLASIRSDRPSAVSDSSEEDDIGIDPRLNASDTSREEIRPQVRQRSESDRSPMAEVIGQNQDGHVIFGITNANLEIGSSGE